MAQSPRSDSFHPAYSLWLADPGLLQRTLVGNEEIIRDFLQRLNALEKGGAPNHLLLVGPRGIGKTHLLCLARYYVMGRLPPPEGWIHPSDAWACPLFTEEEYAGQNSLANFLISLFDKLREEAPLEELWHLPAQMSDQTDEEVVDCCFERLQRFHAERKKRVLIVLDNLQKILEQWRDDEHYRLRGFFSKSSAIVILGSAPSVFRKVMDQKAAFHDFFEIRILAELTTERVLDLLGRRFQEDGRSDEFWARRDELARKIPAIQVLTGGNPRLVVFLYQIAARSSFLEIETALCKLIEELREYFVKRFDELPDQARKVLDTIAQMEGPATPSEIAQAARLTPPLVNSQLKRLKEGHYVRPIKLKRQRETRYDINERIFRIWRQTATVAGRQRFKFLADFLKLYFSPEEVRGMYSQHLDSLRTTADLSREEILRHVEELFYFQAVPDGEIRHGAFSSRMDALLRLGESRRAEDEAQYFASESLQREDKPGITLAYSAQAAIHTEMGQIAEAVQDLSNLFQGGAYQEAFEAAQKLVATSPNAADAWLYLGMAAGNMGNHERALEAFRKVADLGKPTAELWWWQAAALRHLKRYDEALACAKQAVKLDPKNSAAWKEVGLAAGNLGIYERALEAFRKVAELGKPTAELWRWQAMAMRLLKRYQDALGCAEKAVALEPDYADAWQEVGSVACNLGNYERGLEALRKAAELGKPTAQLWWFQAGALMLLNRYQDALGCAEEAVALDPKDASAWQALGLAALSLFNYNRALEAFRKAAEVGKPTAELWQLQALALLRLARYQDALGCAEQAVTLDPNHQFAWLEVGTAATNLGNHDRALEAVRKAAELRKPTAELWRLQASALHKMGRTSESLSCLDKALAEKPDDSMSWLDKAWILGQTGQTERALEATDQAKRHGCLPRDYHHYRGDSLFFSGRFAEAVSELDAGLKAQPNDYDLNFDRELALACLGHHGPKMEALPGAIDRAKIPAGSEVLSYQYILDGALHSLQRGQRDIAIGLFNAGMGMTGWQQREFFGQLTGNFLRQVLDVQPQVFTELVGILAQKVSNENVRKLLEPFLKAAEFIEKKDVVLLEKLFPETRELVLDIVRRIDPELHKNIGKLGLQSSGG